jgi:hypothetical protein
MGVWHKTLESLKLEAYYNSLSHLRNNDDIAKYFNQRIVYFILVRLKYIISCFGSIFPN